MIYVIFFCELLPFSSHQKQFVCTTMPPVIDYLKARSIPMKKMGRSWQFNPFFVTFLVADQTHNSMTTKSKMLTVGLFWLMVSPASIAQTEKEKEAIKAVIVKETTAYQATDNKAWMDCWVHAPYAYWSLADSTGFNTYEGWKAIEIGFTDYFLTSKPQTATTERKWHEIRVYGNGAYARFVQITTTEGKTIEEDELRILEKHNNQWKIVLVGVMKGSKKNQATP